jgi:branched-chain amino acid transport system ATP-binding protein
VLEVKNINVFYGDVQVIWDVSFHIQTGEIVALIGANGAGKSTILRTISGLLRPKAGSILLDGKPIHTIDPFQLITLGLAHIPEARRLFVEMTVEENLDMGSLHPGAKQKRKETKEMVFDLFPRLRERSRQPAGTLSGGEQQMLAIARGLMGHPNIVMLDEPSLGLAPILVQEIFKIITDIRKEGKTVLIVEQNVRQTLAIADRAYVLETGKIEMEGEGKNMLNDEHIRAAYLGV